MSKRGATEANARAVLEQMLVANRGLTDAQEALRKARDLALRDYDHLADPIISALGAVTLASGSVAVGVYDWNGYTVARKRGSASND